MVSAWWLFVAVFLGFVAGALLFSMMSMASETSNEFEHLPHAGGPM